QPNRALRPGLRAKGVAMTPARGRERGTQPAGGQTPGSRTRWQRVRGRWRGQNVRQARPGTGQATPPRQSWLEPYRKSALDVLWLFEVANSAGSTVGLGGPNQADPQHANIN